MRHLRQRSFSLKGLLKRSFRINPPALMLASMVTVLALYGFRVPIFELIELKTYDLRFVSRGPLAPSPAALAQVTLLNQLASQLDTLVIGDSRLRRFLSEPRFEADNDVALVKTIKRSRAAVVLGCFFHTQLSRDIAV